MCVCDVKCCLWIQRWPSANTASQRGTPRWSRPTGPWITVTRMAAETTAQVFMANKTFFLHVLLHQSVEGFPNICVNGVKKTNREFGAKTGWKWNRKGSSEPKNSSHSKNCWPGKLTATNYWLWFASSGTVIMGDTCQPRLQLTFQRSGWPNVDPW